MMNNDSDDCCSCGFNWSAKTTQTPIPENEIPSYLIDLSKWDTTKHTDMTGVFSGATATLDLKNET